MKQHPRDVDGANADEQMERLVFEYLRYTGKIIPQTPEDVARVEELLKPESTVPPERLRDASLIFSSPSVAPPKVLMIPAHPDPATAQNLARAAREGGKVSPEVEAEMRKDRERAEREVDLDE
jgi:hypothetical protein